MPQRQSHRGKHPEDGELFAAKWHARLRDAVADLSYLLTRGYSEGAALKLVGDHYQLHLRQRSAVVRAACSDDAVTKRKARQVGPDDVRGGRVLIDGYNVLIGVESALSGGVLIACRDGCIRDIASIHGSYRKVQETLPALELIGKTLEAMGIEEAVWYLDAPISNSGELAGIMRGLAEQNGWPWRVELHANPDKLLQEAQDVVVTSDSMVLDRTQRWLNMMSVIVERMEPRVEVVTLASS